MIPACDCPPGRVRVDADGKCFSCSGGLDHLRQTVRGVKPASADEPAAQLFDREPTP